MDELHVVFGATGALGYSIVKELIHQKKNVRAVVRNADSKFSLLTNTDFYICDALDKKQVLETAKNATHIYNCVNVIYSEWESKLPVITENILEASKINKAHLIFPGNVYGYGKFEKLPFSEEHPLNASTKKGKIRNLLEEKLMRAHGAGDIKLVIPRFPDFYGPNVTNKLMAPLFKNAISDKKVAWPGSLETIHNFGYIEDLAKAAVLLGSHEECYGEVWHVAGNKAITGAQFINYIFENLHTKAKVTVLTPTMLKLVGLFNVQAKELIELMYEYTLPYEMDQEKFLKKFPEFEFTSYKEGVHETIQWFKEFGKI